MSSDSDVIKAVLRGEIERYAELVDRYQRTAIQVAFSFVGNYEDAKELSQNGFVKAYQHLRWFRGQAKFSTWLFRIIVNECKDFFRRRGRQPTVVALSPDPDVDGQALFDVVDSGADPRDELANKELASTLTKAIEGLPMQQRTAFVLHHLHGMALEELSDVMRCRVGTVKSHLFRATERLRTVLSPGLVTRRML